jgi:hypothetical protein
MPAHVCDPESRSEMRQSRHPIPANPLQPVNLINSAPNI